MFKEPMFKKGGKQRLNWILSGILILLISGCASTPKSDGDRPDIDGLPQDRPNKSAREPVPKYEAHSRFGNKSPYTVLGKSYRVLPDSTGYKVRGTASWYGSKFHGRKTSSGEVYDMFAFTAAHKELPLPTYAEVTNLSNGRSVIVKINDRGPFHDQRIIDLSFAAAEKLDMVDAGTANVEVRAINVEPTNNGTGLGQPIYLQIGAYSARARADSVRKQLQENGFRSVDIETIRRGAQRLWRVRTGPFTRLKALNDAEYEVRQLGLGNPVRVTESN